MGVSRPTFDKIILDATQKLKGRLVEIQKEPTLTYGTREKGILYGKGEYRVTQHPENGKWYVFGSAGGGQWMQVTPLESGFASKEEALKRAEFLEEGV